MLQSNLSKKADSIALLVGIATVFTILGLVALVGEWELVPDMRVFSFRFALVGLVFGAVSRKNWNGIIHSLPEMLVGNERAELAFISRWILFQGIVGSVVGWLVIRRYWPESLTWFLVTSINFGALIHSVDRLRQIRKGKLQQPRR